MTQEEKAKAYDEVREKIALRFGSNVAEEIFSKFEDSDDERIRKELIELIGCMHDADHRKERWLAWLEKQRERLWSIKDAKDGDVLVSQYNKPFIYNGNHDSLHIGSYCGISVEDRFNVATEKCNWTENANIHPATKEQRDTLMKAMSDAGYTFDFEKKELKLLITNGGDFESENCVQNPAWSEKDKNFMYDTLSNLTELKDRYGEGYGNVGKCIKWLKSIKEKVQPQNTWKPSDEQNEALEHFVRSIGESGYASPYDNNTKLLYSLLEQLKKLKG